MSEKRKRGSQTGSLCHGEERAAGQPPRTPSALPCCSSSLDQAVAKRLARAGERLQRGKSWAIPLERRRLTQVDPELLRLALEDPDVDHARVAVVDPYVRAVLPEDAADQRFELLYAVLADRAVRAAAESVHTYLAVAGTDSLTAGAFRRFAA